MPARRTIGVDLGGTKLLAGAVDPSLGVHHRVQRTVTGLQQRTLLDIAVEAVAETRESAGAEVDAVGFGLPALIDRRTGKVEAGVHTPLADLAFAWRAIRAVKSNAILLADDGATVGVGMGQVNRVDSARLAVARAGDRAKGSVAASDAFFPFADGLEVLLEAGVRAVVEPGGSVRDEEVIAAAQQAGVALYFSGTRHFFH